MKCIYYNPVMKLFGETFVKNYGFEHVPNREEAVETEGILWFGVYDEADGDALLGSNNKIHLHWAGTDTYWCLNNGYVSKLAHKANITHSCENVQQVQALASAGVNARICPLFSENMDEFKYTKAKGKPRVVVYAPGRALYNTPMMIEIARKMPKVGFDFIGSREKLNLPKNAIDHGHVSQAKVKKLLKECTVYLRITEHDALPNLVTKAMLLGKHVVTNHLFPFATNANDVITAVDAINGIIKRGTDNKQACFLYGKDGLYINNWSKIFRDGQDPQIDIFIVNSRGDSRWFHAAVDSAKSQIYSDFNVFIVDNEAKEATIGQCYNYAVEQSTADYVYFLGDDDYMSVDMISSSITGLLLMKERMPHTVYAGTYVTLIDEKDEILGYSPVIPTGLWQRSWLVENPFREDLAKLVDSELLGRCEDLGFAKTIIPYHFGYYYRQHPNQVSGMKKALWTLPEDKKWKDTIKAREKKLKEITKENDK